MRRSRKIDKKETELNTLKCRKKLKYEGYKGNIRVMVAMLQHNIL